MYVAKIDQLEFTPAVERSSTFLGRVSFVLNGFMNFRRLPVHRTSSEAIRMDFPVAASISLPDHIRQGIEEQIVSAVGLAEGFSYE